VADLIFSQSPINGSPTPLIFGDGEVVIPTVEIHAAIALGSVDVQAWIVGITKINATITLGGVESVAVMAYDNRVDRYMDTRAKAQHQTALPSLKNSKNSWGVSTRQLGGRDAAWRSAQHTRADAHPTWTTAKSALHDTRAITELAIHQAKSSAIAYDKAMSYLKDKGSAYQTANHTGMDKEGRLQTGIFKVIYRVLPSQTAKFAPRQYVSPSGASLRFKGIEFKTMPWQQGGRATPGRSVFPHPLPPVPIVISSDLLFQSPRLAMPYLVFGYLPTVSDAPTYILPARFYMAIHSVIALRLPDNAEIPIFNASVSSSVGDYCWSLTASGPSSLFEMLAPVDGMPAMVQLIMDGIDFVFVVDKISKQTQFGQTGVYISGRSVTSLIAEPYKIGTAYNNATDQTAQQIATDILADTGITLDWGIGSGSLANGGLIDWLIPAGVFSHMCNPLRALTVIAESAGGYLQSHRSEAVLMMRHPYGTRLGDNPGAPWGWYTGASDIELATDALITESIECKEGANINGVYVSGESKGILALVKRTGTAADRLAPMMTDALITHIDAARQRGLARIGQEGRKQNITLELPVLTGTNQPGIIDVGKLIQVNTSTPWRGRVRSVSVSAKRPQMRQTITVERHLEDVA
jgi:hypothetical protein